MKTCTKCKVEKPFDAFSKRTAAKDGLQSHCKECKLEYQRNNPDRKAVKKRYYDANRDQCISRAVKSQQKKPDYYTAKQKKWQEENREHYLAQRRKNYRLNPANHIERQHRRRGRISGMEGLPPAYTVETEGFYFFCSIFNRFRCDIKGRFEVDHIIPVNGATTSGLHVPANLQILTRSENAAKGNQV